MIIRGLTVRDFRGYREANVSVGAGLTVISGPNGAGKTNMLEALYFGCTGRSCRTANEREVVRFGTSTTRVVVRCDDEDGPHELSVGFSPGQPKRIRIDGSDVDRLLDAPGRPLVSVFLPDRLELVKGAPALRRAHLDRFVAALWPARTATRRAYAQALAQRNALIARVRAGRGSRDALHSWDLQLAHHGIALMRDREQAVAALSEPFGGAASLLGLGGGPAVTYRPRSKASDADQLAGELGDRTEGDLERGFTGHGPHRDEVVMSREGRELRVYGSQGQQRMALLALLLGERQALADQRSAQPLLLLDDVMSELDQDHRQALIELLRTTAGQAVITTTDVEHVPGATDLGVVRLEVSAGTVLEDAIA